MTASLKIKNERYYAVINYKEGDKYKQKWISLKLSAKNNKRKAELMLEQIKKSEDIYVKKIDEITVADFLTNWIGKKRTSLSPVTFQNYKSKLDFAIIPYFKKNNTLLIDLKPIDIKDFLSWYAEGKDGGIKRAYGTIRAVRSVLKCSLNDAVLSGYMQNNPVDYVKTPKSDVVKKTKENFLTSQQANELLKLFENNRLQPLIYITLCYGLRLSEALGLKWSAIDLENNTISINHTVYVDNEDGLVKGKDKTKTASSCHTFELLPDVKDVLTEIKKAQKKKCENLGIEFLENRYVFSWGNGQPWHPGSTSMCFSYILKKSGFQPVISFHGLRHSTATILHDNKWDLKDIQGWLRHSDMSTTANIYTHLSKERDCQIAQSISSLIEGKIHVNAFKKTNSKKRTQ